MRCGVSFLSHDIGDYGRGSSILVVHVRVVVLRSYEAGIRSFSVEVLHLPPVLHEDEQRLDQQGERHVGE